MSKPKKLEMPDNFYATVYEFMMKLKLSLGANIVIAFTLEEGELWLMFMFHKIPRLKSAEKYIARFEPEDMIEPTENLTQVIVEHVKAYMESGGKSDDVEKLLLKKKI